MVYVGKSMSSALVSAGALLPPCSRVCLGNEILIWASGLSSGASPASPQCLSLTKLPERPVGAMPKARHVKPIVVISDS